MDCPDERTWKRRRRSRRYGLPPIHLPQGMDELYREQAAQLKHQIHRAEKATQELEEQRTRAARAEYSLATLQAQMHEYEARRGIGGWIEKEEEPEETHWDKGTQTEDDVMDQCLPPKKRPIRIEEESP